MTALPRSTASAARIPATAITLTIRPASTDSTATVSGTRTTRRSASSCSLSGRPTSVRPVARKIRTVSSVNPGEVATSSSTDQCSAA